MIKTFIEEENENKQKVLKAKVLNAAKEIHTRIPTYRPVLNPIAFLETPYSSILDNVLIKENIKTLKDKSGLLMNLEGWNSNAMVNNLAKVVSREFDIYREIVEGMKEETTRLTQHLSAKTPVNYNLPEIIIQNMNGFIEVYYGVNGEDLETEYGNGVVNTLPSELTGSNVKEKLLESLVEGVTDGEKLLLPMSSVRILSVISNYIARDNKFQLGYDGSFKELAIIVMFRAYLMKFHPTAEMIHQIGVSLMRAVTKHSKQDPDTLIIMSGQDSETPILVSGDKYSEMLDGGEASLILGYWLVNKGASQVSYQDVISRRSISINRYDQHIIAMTGAQQLSNERKVRKYFADYFSRFDTMHSGTTMERIRKYKSDIALYTSIGKALSKLSTEDMFIPKRVIEAVFLDVLFEDTNFSKFYRVSDNVVSDSATSKTSVGIFYVICLMLLNGV